LRALAYLLGHILLLARLHRVLIWINRNTPRVLCYHACEPEENDFTQDLNLNTPPQTFASHLAFLASHYHVISLTRLAAGTPPPRSVVITFDDGYRSVYQNAFPLLRTHQMPATLYLVTSVIDNHSMLWMNELTWLHQHHSATIIPMVGRTLGLGTEVPWSEMYSMIRRRLGPRAIAQLLDDLWKSVGGSANLISRSELYLTARDLDEMARAGISLGNHSATHPGMLALDSGELKREVVEAGRVLERYLGAVKSFAYPWGEHNQSVREVVSGLGYRSIMKMGGWNNPLDLQAVARVNVSSMSVAQLFTEMEILAPAKARLAKLMRGARSSAVAAPPA
jgi:peptidoglycan/xylan/chitin deacetylase (PgdA/CDA1 family)